LFNLYLSGASHQELYPTLHTLPVFILCHHTDNIRLACPTDYFLCLASLTDPIANNVAWNFRKPSDIIRRFAALQFCLQMIYFTHCYTMAYGGGTLWVLSQNTQWANFDLIYERTLWVLSQNA